jgi:hypothetical protein
MSYLTYNQVYSPCGERGHFEPTFPSSVPLPKSWPNHAKAATLHVISLAHFVLTHVRGFAVNSPIHRVRLDAERDRLDSEVALLREEIRIKDARMAALAPHRRPHYSPTERMAILELMAARGWAKAEAGRHFLVTDDTVASWSGRIEEDEPGALVKTTVPVNKFPDFVAAMVIKLKTLFPMMGRRRIAGFLARAGLHIAASTVRRMLNRKPAAQPPAPLASAENPDQPPSSAKPCTVIANYPNHVWGLDTTAVPTSAGWYNDVRPHSSIADATPDEVFHRRRPANRRRRFEPRPRYPANGACAAPRVPARSKIGARLDLVATSFRGARHLAQVEIRRGN